MGGTSIQKQPYINKPILMRGHIGASTRVAQQQYVTNPTGLQRLQSYDKTYGQSPRVEDDYNAHDLLGAPKLREICIA